MELQTAEININEMYGKYHKHVFQYIISLCSNFDTAEDITQEAFIQAHKSRDSFDPGKGSFLPWIKVIAKNKYLRSMQNFSSKHEASTDLVFLAADSRDSCENKYNHSVIKEQLKQAVSQLQEPERSIILFRYEKNLKLDEIAREINISRRTVSRKYFNAVKLLKRELQNQDLL